MGKTEPRLISTAERRAYVLQLRRSGATYRAIADAAVKHFTTGENPGRLPKGWDERYAYKDVMRELTRIRDEIAEDATQVITLELERLDRLFMAMWQRALNGDEKAIDRCLRIMSRRADLLGLDAPKRQEITGADGGPVPIQVVREVRPDDD